jgi:hypothetical protein
MRSGHSSIGRSHSCRGIWCAGLCLTVGVALLATLAGCSGGATATPMARPSPSPMSTGTSDEGFAIYLTNPEVRPDQLVMLSHLELAAEPILSSSDIVNYVWATHEITLTAAALERLHALSVPTSGKSFAVCVDGAPIYAGAFWVGYSSQSFDGVVIDATLVTAERPVVQIQLGYPGPGFFRGEDPRSDPRIKQALEREGKLR